MSNSKRVAIIGMGPMGRRHLQALHLVDNAELIAVADSRPQACAGLELNGARAYTNSNALLNELHPEVVVVATNGPSHHALVLASIAAGARDILCEKPMACSVAEAEEMIAAADNQKCALAVNFWRRNVPAYCWLAKQLQSGEWGTLRSVRGGCPGIGLGCTATHVIDLWDFLGGEQLSTVSGWIDPVRASNPRGSEFCDPGGMILVTSASGTRYSHEQLEDGAGPCTLTIETTGAQISVDEYRRSIDILIRDLSVKPGPGRPPKYDPFPMPPEVPLALDIVRSSAETLRQLVDGYDLSCPAMHGLRSLEVIVGAYLSHERGHAPVALPLTDRDWKAKWLPIT